MKSIIFYFPLKRHLVFARQVSLVRLVRSSEAARVQMWIWWLWWQSNTIHSTQHFLVAIASPSVEKLCRAIATIVRSYYYFAELLLQLLCGATYTFTTIVQSFYYCAEPLLLPLCRASTLVQSFYYYSCAGREGTVSPIISRWRRIATTDQKQLKTINNSTMLLATMFMERKPSHPPRMFRYTKSGWNMVKLFDLEVKILHFIFP